MQTISVLRAATAALLALGMTGLGTAAFADDAVPPSDPAVTVAPPADSAPADSAPAADPPAADPAPADPAPAADPAPPAPEPSPGSEPGQAPDATSPDPAPTTSGPAVEAGARLVTTRTTAAAVNNTKVTLCHATQGVNPWNKIEIDEQGAYNGHVEPANGKNDHVNDIIPSFSYKVKGDTFVFPGQNLGTLFNGVLGSTILANDCAVPAPKSYVLVAWSLPCGVADIWCPPGQSFVASVNLTQAQVDPANRSALNALDGQLLGACTDYQVDLYNASATTTALIAGQWLYGPNNPAEDLATGAIPGNPWKFIDNPDCPVLTAVTPQASATDQSCVQNATLAGGVITVAIMNGVHYSIKKDGTNDLIPFDGTTGATGTLDPGTYIVSYTLDAGYQSLASNPLPPLTIGAYTQPCGVTVTPAATATDEDCLRNATIVQGHIQLTMFPGIVTYTITGPGGNVPFDATGLTGDLPAGSYSVDFTLAPGYVSATPKPIPVTITGYDGVCGVEVTPSAVADPQTCIGGLLAGGKITLNMQPGIITYTSITGPSGAVAFDPVTGETGEIEPGTYSVAYTLAAGYIPTTTNPFDVFVTFYDGPCDLPTDPLVVPQVSFAPPTCTSAGSYTLANDLGIAGAVKWTVDGTPGVTDGTYPATTGSTVTIEAAPNSPGFGFNVGQQTTWTHTFSLAGAVCAQTLAFTGSTAELGLGWLAAVLTLSGLLLVRARVVLRRRTPAA